MGNHLNMKIQNILYLAQSTCVRLTFLVTAFVSDKFFSFIWKKTQQIQKKMTLF